MPNETRRTFLKQAAVGVGASGLAPLLGSSAAASPQKVSGQRPLVVSTWRHGLAANETAWRRLERGESALDAAEAGVRVSEADPKVTSVGLGGNPDREGKVTLDACIMDKTGSCGAVAFLEHIVHPISVARLVMEKTPHVMLVGTGALEFALSQGFEKANLLTPEAEARWREWKKTSVYRPMQHSSQRQELPHDTIGMLTLDRAGDLGGACTTSGLAYKLRGRVGDSPIIGAALYVDNQIGAACATGVGELVMKTVGSFLIVELMRQGASPEEACRQAAQRIVERGLAGEENQVGYLAINKAGVVGASSLRPGFEFAVHDETGGSLKRASHLL